MRRLLTKVASEVKAILRDGKTREIKKFHTSYIRVTRREAAKGACQLGQLQHLRPFEFFSGGFDRSTNTLKVLDAGQ